MLQGSAEVRVSADSLASPSLGECAVSGQWSFKVLWSLFRPRDDRVRAYHRSEMGQEKTL